VRILVFHGYLLQGTGSNVYNANLAAALARLGHEVHLLCQDRAPQALEFVDAVGDWDAGELRLRTLREPVRCTVYRPALAGLLPVYVADRYEGIEARPFEDCSEAEIDAYVAANVGAVREVVERVAPDVALANHLVMGPLVLARALGGAGAPHAPAGAGGPGGGVSYAVKVHGSALEYTVKPHPRFLPAARKGIAGARAVLVGSRHVAESLWAALAEPDLPARTRLGPPGVDVARFTPREPEAARAGVAALARRLAAQAASGAQAAGGAPAADAAPAARAAPAPAGAASAFARDAGEAARALASVAEGAAAGDRLVAFVGKLIVSKGVDLLLAAWPLVLAAQPRARLVIVGFGAYRPAFERLLAALADGDLATVAALAAEGRAAEGGPREPLALLEAFLASLQGDERARYLAAAGGLRERVVLTGRLDHDELAELLPACEALVVPSTFPEAFGMVAAEAAACGALPICAEHSGLAEVAGALAEAVPAEAAPWLTFRTSASPAGGRASRAPAGGGASRAPADGGVSGAPADGGASGAPAGEAAPADAPGAVAPGAAAPRSAEAAGPEAAPGVPDPVRGIADRVVAWLAAPQPLRATTREAIVATVRERWSWEGVARGVIAAAQGRLGELPEAAPLEAS
jgi:glycosyltransferase involved in cell wall biosynthesis